MAIGVAIIGWISSGAGTRFTANTLLNNAVPTFKDVTTPEKVAGFLAATSRAPDEMRALILAEGQPPAGLERYWFNPLWRYPLAHVGGGYTVPSLWLLLQRITSGVYFDFLEPRLGNKKAILGFTSFLGKIFEQHVGRELGDYYKPDDLRPEQPYLNGQWATADWTLIEGRRATLFECKTSRLNKKDRERGDVQAIRAKLHEDIIPAIERFKRKGDDLQQHAPGLETWPDVDDFEFVIVTLDPWWPEVLTRQIIAEELAGTPAASTRFHLMWVEQLEHLGSYSGALPIFDLLRKRWSIPDDFDTRDFLYRMAVDLGITTSSPRMNQMADEFFSAILPEGTWA